MGAVQLGDLRSVSCAGSGDSRTAVMGTVGLVMGGRVTPSTVKACEEGSGDHRTAGYTYVVICLGIIRSAQLPCCRFGCMIGVKVVFEFRSHHAVCPVD